MRTYSSCVVRQSSALLALPVVAIVVVLHFALRDRGWRREWLWAFDMLAFSVMLTGPVIAGVAAWEGVRWARCRSVVAVADRSPVAVVQYVIALVGWVWALYLVAALVLFGVVIGGPLGGLPSPTTLTTMLPLAALLAAEISGGFVVGWTTRHGFVAPMVAVATFVVSLVGYTIEPGLFFEIGGATSSLLGLAPRPTLQLAQACWWSLVACAAMCAAVVVCDRRPRPARWLLLGLLAALAAVGSLIVSMGVLRFRPTETGVECSGTEPQICLADGYHDLRPVLTAQLEPAWAAVAAAGITVPARVTQNSSDHGDAATIGRTAPLDEVELSAMVVGALVAPNCDLYAAPGLLEAFANVNYWVGRAIGIDGSDPSIDPVLADDTPAARAFIRTQVGLLGSCAPS